MLFAARVRLLLDLLGSSCGEHPPWDEALGRSICPAGVQPDHR